MKTSGGRVHPDNDTGPNETRGAQVCVCVCVYRKVLGHGPRRSRLRPPYQRQASSKRRWRLEISQETLLRKWCGNGHTIDGECVPDDDDAEHIYATERGDDAEAGKHRRSNRHDAIIANESDRE